MTTKSGSAELRLSGPAGRLPGSTATRSGGGLCNGYDLIPGQTRAQGINQAGAAIVRRIYQECAAGRGPRMIAAPRNEEGVPGPFGRPWRDTAIRGHITRATGILNNELHIGRWCGTGSAI